MRNYADVLVKPMISEKTIGMIEENKYTFIVAKYRHTTPAGRSGFVNFNTHISQYLPFSYRPENISILSPSRILWCTTWKCALAAALRLPARLALLCS